MTAEESFLSSIEPAVESLRRHSDGTDVVRVVTHSDADGLAAGGILSQVLRRLDIPFRVTCEKRIDEDQLKAVAAERPPLVIFSDLGSGSLDSIRDHLKEPEVAILDHHLQVEAEAPNLIHVNPMLHGLDGSRGVSGAGIAYLFAKAVDKRNHDLSPLGIVGALADQQDKGDKKTLMGINRLIEADAKGAELLETGIDLAFYGRETRPIAQAMAYTTDPFIPGLSGREDSCYAFLRKAGIELKRNGRWRALRDLSEDEKRDLFSTLSKHMIHEGFGTDVVHELIGTVYTLKAEESWTPMRDGREYASLLNACARMERPSVGLSICLGDRGPAVIEGEGILGDYRKRIAGYLEWIREGDRIAEMANVYTLRAEGDIDERIVGVVASILISTGLVKRKKPIVASARADKGLIKISARATEEIASLGIDLGSALMEAAVGFEGRGGGHDIAAGAFIPEKNEEGFLGLVDRIVGEQRHG